MSSHKDTLLACLLKIRRWIDTKQGRMVEQAKLYIDRATLVQDLPEITAACNACRAALQSLKPSQRRDELLKLLNKAQTEANKT